jgi:hypothetical protein
MTEKVEIPAIHDQEFIGLLEKFGLLAEVNDNKAACFNCQEPLTLDNIGGLKVMNNKPKPICDNPECLSNE